MIPNCFIIYIIVYLLSSLYFIVDMKKTLILKNIIYNIWRYCIDSLVASSQNPVRIALIAC